MKSWKSVAIITENMKLYGPSELKAIICKRWSIIQYSRTIMPRRSLRDNTLF